MKTIHRDALKEIVEGAGPAALVDVMPPEHYSAVHLPGAVNCCVYEMNFMEQVAKVAPEKGSTVIVYGTSAHSLASLTAAEKLERAGYTAVLDYRGGLEDWREAGLPVEGSGEPPSSESPREGRHTVDIEKSKVIWTGRNINGAHTGTIQIKSGWLEVALGPVVTGEFILDMESIADADLTDSTMNRMLVTHLKSDDFFDTVRFPIATFRLRHVTLNERARPGNINADIDGTLTLKGTTEDIGFPAVIEVLAGGALSAEAHFDIDRTRWNVMYGSGKFYEWLGKHLVHDLVSLSLHIVTS